MMQDSLCFFFFNPKGKTLVAKENMCVDYGWQVKVVTKSESREIKNKHTYKIQKQQSNKFNKFNEDQMVLLKTSNCFPFIVEVWA